jgi:transmembrane sensor
VLDDKTPPPPPVERIIAEAEARRTKVEPIRGRFWTPSRLVRWASVAAAATVVLGVGVTTLDRNPDAVFDTGPEETSTVALNDGSVVRLGQGSHLEVWGTDHRAVRLQGTAFFAVASDSSRPFTISTDAGTAEVLGTRFELRAEPDSLRLVVVEGLVILDADGQRVEVGEGSMSWVLNGSPPAQPRAANVWDLLSWSDGLLIFQSTPLTRVMGEVSEHFGMPVGIRDSVLAQRSVTAWFGDESLEEVVNTVCQVVGARCAIGDTVEVSR